MALNTAKAVVVMNSLTARFNKGVRTATPFYPTLCLSAGSDGLSENYGLIGDVPQVREWLGDRQAKELRAATYEVTNKDFELTLRIPKNRINDDRFGIYGPIMERLGMRARKHPDVLLVERMVAAESSKCFDGVNFFSDSHAWGDSGTQDNLLTYNATDHTAVTAAEFKASFNKAVEALIGFKDDQGQPFIEPTIQQLTGLVVAVPKELRQAAHEALYAQLSGGGNTNIVIDTPKIITVARFTSAVKWQLYDTQNVLPPFVYQQREPISTGFKGQDDMETKDLLFMSQGRYEMGYLAWFAAVQTEFN